MDFLADIRVVDGPVQWFAWGAGAAGLAWLIRLRLRRRPAGPAAAEVGAAVLLAAALVAAVHWLLIYGLSVFPEELPFDVLVWSLPAVTALLLWLRWLGSLWTGRRWTGRLWTGRSRRGPRPEKTATPCPDPAHPHPARPHPAGAHSAGVNPARPRPARRGLAAAAATGSLVGAVALSAVQINAYFGLNNTVGDLAGTAVARIVPLEPGLMRSAGAGPAVSLAEWKAPAGLPPGGVLRRAEIPGTASGFDSREAYLYLPPAYQVSPRPELPVLVLFSGQPGAPSDWLTGGALRSRLDRFAAGHAGLAPVVVVVDPNGSAAGNTLCMDSRIAQADTFLARDVPEWINKTLAVDPDPRQWAVGGFSFGATCAMQMVTRHPEVYNAALAFASEKEPALAKERDKTIQAAFGGDTAAFERQTPLQLMKERRFAESGVYFGAGERDPEFVEYMDLLSAAARDAGFAVEDHRIPGAGHSWETASRGLPGGLEFLAGRWGIRP